MIGDDRRSPAEFSRRMFPAVCRSALGGFDDNLWGLAFTTEFETRTVDLYLFFSAEPTDLDRYEISEMVFAFHTIEEAGLRVHRTVMARDRLAFGTVPMQWCFVRRHPEIELPDDAGFDELDH